MRPSLQFLLLSCKKATALSDKKSETGLTWTENVQLRMHISICDGCKTYIKQSEIIERTLHLHFGKLKEQELPVEENKELKERILSKL
jgi:hypothetical protein